MRIGKIATGILVLILISGSCICSAKDIRISAASQVTAELCEILEIEAVKAGSVAYKSNSDFTDAAISESMRYAYVVEFSKEQSFKKEKNHECQKISFNGSRYNVFAYNRRSRELCC